MNECNVGLQDFNPLFPGMSYRLRAEHTGHSIKESSQFSFGFADQRLTIYSDGIVSVIR